MIYAMLLLLAFPAEAGVEVIRECRQLRTEAIERGISKPQADRLYLECLENG